MPSPTLQPAPLLFDAAWAAQLLGVSIRTVRRETIIGRLPCARLGGRTVRYSQDHVDEYIRRCTDDGGIAA